MTSLKSLLLSWNGQLPSTFAGLAVDELQFAYALFQLVRNNTLFLLLVFLLPNLLMKLLYLGRFRVVLISEKRQYNTGMEALPGCLHYLSKLDLGDVQRRSKHWYSVSSGNRHYLCHQNSLMPLADLCKQRYTDRFLFADSVVEVTDRIKVAKLISTSEAVDKLLIGDYQLSDADGYTFYYCFDWLKVDSNWIPVLSSLPIYLKAIGADNLSGALSCLVILLDLLKNLIWKVYDELFTKLTVFAKLRILGKRTWLYNFLGVFSDRWKYCDTNVKYAYILKSGSHVCIGHRCRFKGEHDFQVVEANRQTADFGPNVEYKEGEVVQWSHRDEDYYFDIIDGMAHFRQRTWGNFYLYVKTGCDIFVSDAKLL